MTEIEPRVRRVPADSFRVRLAIVRTEMGWNYDQAEAATGIGSESWRQWEKGLRRCTDVIGVSRKIAENTPYDPAWLALGGPLSEYEEDPRPPAARVQDGGRAATVADHRRKAKAATTEESRRSTGGFILAAA